MRFLQRVAAATAAVLVLSLVSPTSPAMAADIDEVTDGDASGGSIRAIAGYRSGPSSGGIVCPWASVWPDTSSGSVLGVPISGFLAQIFAPFASIPFLSGLFDSDEPDAIRSLTVEEAEQRRDEAEAAGEDAPDFVTDIIGTLGGEEYTRVELVEGDFGFIERIDLALGGAPDLGVVINDEAPAAAPEAPTGPAVAPVDPPDPDELTDEARAYYQARYPLVQRGQKVRTPGDLWWDPYFVDPGAPTSGGCPTGVFYSPRELNADILLPDVVDLVTENLPVAEPLLAPLDQYEGWGYVQVPINFGVSSASVETTVAHASADYIDPSDPGAPTIEIWAQVEAIATHLVFDPGDGNDPVTCDLREMRYVPDDPGDCTYTYVDSSNIVPGNAFTPTVTVIWEGLYTSSTEPPDVIEISPTTTAFTLEVAEARAAVTVNPTAG